MPGGQEQRPGHIVRTMGGKSIEVLNTDAEGRLVLADVKCYAKHLGVTRMLDIATVTGTVVVALGNRVKGVMGKDLDLVDDVLAAGKLHGHIIVGVGVGWREQTSGPPQPIWGENVTAITLYSTAPGPCSYVDHGIVSAMAQGTRRVVLGGCRRQTCYVASGGRGRGRIPHQRPRGLGPGYPAHISRAGQRCYNVCPTLSRDAIQGRLGSWPSIRVCMCCDRNLGSASSRASAAPGRGYTGSRLI